MGNWTSHEYHLDHSTTDGEKTSRSAGSTGAGSLQNLPFDEFMKCLKLEVEKWNDFTVVLESGQATSQTLHQTLRETADLLDAFTNKAIVQFPPVKNKEHSPSVVTDNTKGSEQKQPDQSDGQDVDSEGISVESTYEIIDPVEGKSPKIDEEEKEVTEKVNERCHNETQDGNSSKTIQILTAQIEHLQQENRKITDEKDDIFLRLSKVAGEKLTQNNPNIADLNDKNRPTKLGEMYCELYDNEWTDAFEALTEAGYTEKESISTLQLTFLNVFEFCNKKATLLLKKTEDAVNLLFEEYTQSAMTEKLPPHLTVSKSKGRAVAKALKQQFRVEDIVLQSKWKRKPKEKSDEQTPSSTLGQRAKTQMEAAPVNVDDKMKVLRKEVAGSMVLIVQKAYLDASWDTDCLEELIPFIKKCLYIGWMMVVQSPPLCLHMVSDTPKKPFDTAKYKHYTSSGNEVDYVVWPALLLHKDGPIVAKGVAQAKKSE